MRRDKSFVLISSLIAFLFIPSQPSLGQSVTEEVVVTASVPPTSADVELSIEASKTDKDLLDQGDEIEVRVKYRSSLSNARPFRLEAVWEKGLIEGSSFNYIDVFEYLTDTATPSDDGTSPTIDLQNATITWDIPSLAPSETEKMVIFKLRVRSNLPTEKKIRTYLKARARIANTTLPEDQHELLVQKGSRPGPSPTPTPTPAPTGPALASPTPLRIIQPFKFEHVALDKVTNTTALILFKTNQRSTFGLAYGENPLFLTKKLQRLTFDQLHRAEITNLAPDTRYYFQLTAITEDGRTTVSDIYTFKTALAKEVIPISKEKIVLAWSKVILASEDTDNVVVPQEVPFAISVSIDEPEKLAQLTAKFQSAQVLGINNRMPTPPIEEAKLIEILPGIFSGEILSPSLKGQHLLILEIKDVFGGFVSQNLPFQIHVSDPIKVHDRLTGNPIENASLVINKYEPSLKVFKRFGETFSLPYHTDENGQLDLVLPPGVYRFELSAVGYKPLVEKIELGISSLAYPQFFLEPSLSLSDRLLYYKSSIEDTTHFLSFQAGHLFSSQRTRDLALVFAQLALVILSITALSLRMHQGIFGLFFHFGELVSDLFNRLLGKDPKFKLFYLSELNNYHRSISGAVLYFLDNNGHVLAKTKTKPTGKAKVPVKLFIKAAFPLKVIFYRRSYYAYPAILNEDAFAEELINLRMYKDHLKLSSFSGLFEWLGGLLMAVVSDFLVVFIPFLTVLFLKHQGLRRTLPLIGLSVLVILTWLTYIRKLWQLRQESQMTEYIP